MGSNNIKVGIYKEHLGGLHKDYLERYEKILQHNDIDCVWLDASQADFWQKVAQLDFFIYHWEHYDAPRQLANTLLPIIEQEMGISCFPNRATCWHFDDKIKQYYLLRHHGFPMTESNIFWEKADALQWVETASFPQVFKLKSGAGSSNVILVKDKDHARRLINKMFSRGLRSGKILDKGSLMVRDFNPYLELRRRVGDVLRKWRGEYKQLFWQINKGYVLFQKYLPDNKYDIRVSAIGNRAFAFRRLNRDNDFRASGSGAIDYAVDQIDMTAIKIALTITRKMKFQSMAYDFLYSEEGSLEICEISYTYVDSAVYNCPGYWDADLQWHEGHFWPQYCVLQDALSLRGLVQPREER
jgi:hypothetical protein